MKKRVLVGSIVAGLILIGAVGSTPSTESPTLETVQSSEAALDANSLTENVKQTCDGTIVTKKCVLDELSYSTYIYHASVEEKSHTETVTTYEKEITSYCTLCNDGTYSPSCATGRGACSHHGGVGQWNAPRYSNVAVHNDKTIVDSPYQAAYYEKVLE